MATIAVFIALGGSGYAALSLPRDSVGSAQIRDNAIRSRDVKTNALTGADIREGKLKQVPRARNAKRLGGRSLGSLLRCPSRTVEIAGSCIEVEVRPAEDFFFAADVCNDSDRRLPTVAELNEFLAEPGRTAAPGGELTSNVAESRGTAGQLDVVVLEESPFRERFLEARVAERAFRCVTPRVT